MVVDDRSGAELDALADRASATGVRVRRVPRGVLDDLAGGVLHQGVVAVQTAFPYVDVAGIGHTDLVVVLDGVTDPQNLGAIARSAEAAGAGALVVPRRRAAPVGPAAEKAAAGAFGWLRVAQVPNVARGLADLRERGFWSVGLAGDSTTTVWSSRLLDGPVAVVVGGEGAGLSRLVAERVDERVAIPMAGRLDALNASAAAAVALFEVVRRRQDG